MVLAHARALLPGSRPGTTSYLDADLRGGLELLEPGLVQVHRWGPGSPVPDAGDEVPGYAGLARKP